MGKVNLNSTGRVREDTEISHSLRYLTDLEFLRTHGIPNVCECTNSHKWKYSMESLIIPRPWVFEEVRSMGMGNVKFHTMGILWENQYIPIPWALNKNQLTLKTHTIPRYGKLVSL